eukprot:2451355-Pyramimonas_sp.AAC.1
MMFCHDPTVTLIRGVEIPRVLFRRGPGFPSRSSCIDVRRSSPWNCFGTIGKYQTVAFQRGTSRDEHALSRGTVGREYGGELHGNVVD